MRCPFLKETRARFCGKSDVRKMIIRTATDNSEEKCSGPEFTACPYYRQYIQELSHDSSCPFLKTTPVQYCSAAPVPKLIPRKQSLPGRCSDGGFQYCDVYVSAAGRDPAGAGTLMNGIRVPEWLLYSANHMWIDPGQDGHCHIGIDGFLARVLGRVERVSFLAPAGVARPAAVLTVRDVEMQMVFPNPLLVTGCNLHLRADPASLTADPYSLGWLFEGSDPEPGGSVRAGLIGGREAVEWMRGELRRMSGFLAAHSRRRTPKLETAWEFGRDDMLQLFYEFFSPGASWTRLT